ncbi:hypothetical protein BDZ91DRAFT_443916 [Kalaharituber pfeilii]|nr:hypothetical protein BDZ91DRAFT_443916 [Kalaharituber pfeilii]
MDMAHPEYQRHAEFYRMPPMAFTQPAPRQRTAIACRYCRRRKIRCSGFESSQDGRCSNCQRFNQECIFTPVSSQTQAFVPAHAFQQHINPRMAQSYGNSRGGRQYTPGPVQLYGAHGQPLPHSNANEFPPFPSRVPSPSSHSAPYEHYDPHGQESRDRPSSDVHELHPSFPRRSSQGDYPSHWPRPEAPILPLPTTFSQPKDYSPPPTVSPHSYEYQPGPSQSRRTSPPFSSDRPASISPHPPIHPPMWAPPRPESTGPSGSVGPSLHPMQLSNIIDSTQQHQQRSAHDNEMLNQLKRAL